VTKTVSYVNQQTVLSQDKRELVKKKETVNKIQTSVPPVKKVTTYSKLDVSNVISTIVISVKLTTFVLNVVNHGN